MKIGIGNINYTYLNDRFYMYKKTEYDHHIPGDYRSWWLIERDCSCRPNLFRCVFTPFNPFEWGFFFATFYSHLYCCCCSCCHRLCCKRSPSTSRLFRADSYNLVPFSSGGKYSCATKCSG